MYPAPPVLGLPRLPVHNKKIEELLADFKVRDVKVCVCMWAGVGEWECMFSVRVHGHV